MGKNRILARLFSLLAFLTLVFGIPVFLVFAGSPIPTEFESIDAIRNAVENPNSVSSESMFAFGRLVLWILWGYFVCLTVFEVTRSNHKLLIPVIGPVLKKLIAAALILSSTSSVAIAQPVAAVTLTEEGLNKSGNNLSNPGLSEVKSDSLSVPSFYVTELGDSWMSLAERFLGDATKSRQIQALNIGRVVTDGVIVTNRTEILQPGWRLKIPTAQTKTVDIDLTATVSNFDFASFIAGLGVSSASLAGVVASSLKRRRQSIQATAARGQYATFGQKGSAVEAALKGIAAKERGSEIVSFRDLPATVTDIADLPTPLHRLEVSKDYFVSVSSGLKVDLWRIGTCNIYGGPTECANLLRSVLFELDCVADRTEAYASSTLGVDFSDLRGVEVEEIDSLVDRVAPGDEPGQYLTLLIFSSEDYQVVQERLAAIQGEEGIAILFVGETRLEDVENAISLESSSHATMSPGDRTFVPQQLDQSSASEIGKLLDAEPEWHNLATPTTVQQLPVVNLRVLGPVVCQSFPELSSQQLSLVTFLAVNGPTTKDRLMEYLWDGQLISSKRFANLLADTRKIVGRETLPAAEGGSYLVKGIVTDIDLLRAAATSAAGELRWDTNSQVEKLEIALGFVYGQPFESGNKRYWSWVSEHNHVYAEAESLIRDVALALSEIYLAESAYEKVAQVCLHALQGVPLDEALTTRLAEAFVRQGKHASATRLIDDWELRVSSLGFLDPSTSPRQMLSLDAVSPLESYVS